MKWVSQYSPLGFAERAKLHQAWAWEKCFKNGSLCYFSTCGKKEEEPPASLWCYVPGELFNAPLKRETTQAPSLPETTGQSGPVRLSPTPLSAG